MDLEGTGAKAARTDYDVMVAMRAAAEAAGFEHFMVAAPVGPADTSLRDLVRVTSWPPELVMGYDAAGLLATSRAAQEAAGTALPMWWDLEDGDAERTQDGEADVARATTLFTGHGLPRHLAFTVADGNGRRWVVSFSGTGPEPDTAGKAALHMTAVEVAEAIRRIDGEDGGDDRPLTDRQWEVMDWISKGKTSGEIATILGISEHTVDVHAAAACERLDAVNRAQAVGVAVRLGVL